MKKISARNQLKGTVVGVKKGQTTAHVRIDIGNDIVVTSSITNEAVDDLADQGRRRRRGHQGERRLGRKMRLGCLALAALV